MDAMRTARACGSAAGTGWLDDSSAFAFDHTVSLVVIRWRSRVRASLDEAMLLVSMRRRCTRAAEARFTARIAFTAASSRSGLRAAMITVAPACSSCSEAG